MTCQHTVCRDRQSRQDLRCSRPSGHAGNHLHRTALGWCNPRWSHLESAAGIRGGHRQETEAEMRLASGDR